MAPMSPIREEKKLLHPKVTKITNRKVTNPVKAISPVRAVISLVKAISPARAVTSVKVATSSVRAVISPVTTSATSSPRMPVNNKILMPKARQ